VLFVNCNIEAFDVGYTTVGVSFAAREKDGFHVLETEVVI